MAVYGRIWMYMSVYSGVSRYTTVWFAYGRTNMMKAVKVTLFYRMGSVCEGVILGGTSEDICYNEQPFVAKEATSSSADNYMTILRKHTNQMQQKNVQLSIKMCFPSLPAKI